MLENLNEISSGVPKEDEPHKVQFLTHSSWRCRLIKTPEPERFWECGLIHHQRFQCYCEINWKIYLRTYKEGNIGSIPVGSTIKGL